MKIKICGLRKKDEIDVAISSGADAIGLVLAPSKRRVGIAEAKELVSVIPSDNKVKVIGVFLNPTAEEVLRAVEEIPLDYAQIHGDVPTELTEFSKRWLIRAFAANDSRLKEELENPSYEYILIDAPPSKYAGGNGKTFDWSDVPLELIKQRKVIIAGGLNKDNVLSAIGHFSPYGIDVSSGVETDGAKDLDKIKQFIDIVRHNYI